MPDPSPKQSAKQSAQRRSSPAGTGKQPIPPSSLDPEKYAQLKAEMQAPFRGLRQFIYIGCGVSGLIGAFIFLTQMLAGRDVAAAFPNFALQVGVVALMVLLYRWEQRSSRRSKS